ncbi:hypothetical protein [Streptococcus halichoeri]|uniref:hypothetical protein n=1 Tax=Streptococcus halichoeri TaxID=254785 RepID=UPI00135A23B6|nr:hypothetical protein [Streptococcus halichoeri]
MKIVKKKAIITVAALALAGLFGLTQVTTASANQKQYVSTINRAEYRQAIKQFKELFKMKLYYSKYHNMFDVYNRMEELEHDFINTSKGDGLVWKEGFSMSSADTNYLTYHLEDSFKTETFKTKFNKTEDEAEKLVDKYLKQIMDFYTEKYNNS